MHGSMVMTAIAYCISNVLGRALYVQQEFNRSILSVAGDEYVKSQLQLAITLATECDAY